MSTRANIIVHDPQWNRHLLFYRHSDGYPEGVKDTLDKFCEMMKEGIIRSNIEQSSGWLILLGAQEYDYDRENDYEPRDSRISELIDMEHKQDFNKWKVGAYEPAACLHTDIEHLYVVNLEQKEWFEIGEGRKFEALAKAGEQYLEKHGLMKALAV